MKRLCEAVRSCLSGRGGRILCAVSGGADSVALLHALSRAETSLPIEALHVQHGLRGEDSQADERFVRALCQQLNIPLHVRRAQLTGDMNDPGVETRARGERLRIIREVMLEGGFDAVVLGHHRDDQTETVLMHLLRGSGMTGLTGMRPASGQVLRPFLSIPKAQILSALQAEGLRWREDESNAHATNPRNALRLNILPAMEALYPGAGKHVARTAELLQTDSDYLDEQAERLFLSAAYCAPPFRLMAKAPLRSAHPALVRRALRRLCPVPLDADDTLRLEQLLSQPDGSVLNLPEGLRAMVWTHHLHILPKEAAQPEGEHLRIVSDPAQGSVPKSAATVVLSPAMQAMNPVIRLPKPDDLIHPFGAPGAKPLRRYYTDQKVDPCFRWSLPVLACGQDILWIPGLCAAEALRLSAVPPGSIQLSFTASIPFYPYNSKE